MLQTSQPSTSYLRPGDTVEIEVKGLDGRSLFGAIAQEVVAPGGAHWPRPFMTVRSVPIIKVESL
jgi:fumarylacetoacetate (FAA) hydrolase